MGEGTVNRAPVRRLFAAAGRGLDGRRGRSGRGRTAADDALFDYVDRLVDAPAESAAPAPTADMATTVRRVHGALADATPGLGLTRRQQIWEDLMDSGNALSAAPPAPSRGNTPALGKRIATARAAPARPLASRLAARWSPLVSAALIVLLAVGTMAGFQALDRGAGNSASGLALVGDRSLGVQIMTPIPITGTCVEPEPVTPDEELLRMSIDDWPQRSYVPVVPAAPKMAQQAVDTWVEFNLCWQQGGDFPQGFDSDRRRFLGLHDRLPLIEQERVLEGPLYSDAIPQILAQFPLPVNHPVEMISFEDGKSMTWSFAPSDVYQLPDGRYGTVLGTISAESLRTGRTLDDAPNFIAFEQVGDRLLIDEWFPLCQDDVLSGGGSGATPAPQDVLLRCGDPFA